MGYEEVLQRIIGALDVGDKTDIEDWEVIFDVLKGDECGNYCR